MQNEIRELVKSKLIEYPNLPSRTLARLIYNLNPQIFISTESVRNKILYYRGKLGNKRKQQVIRKYGKLF